VMLSCGSQAGIASVGISEDRVLPASLHELLGPTC
jgi:hypothetical protein